MVSHHPAAQQLQQAMQQGAQQVRGYRCLGVVLCFLIVRFRIWTRMVLH